MCGIANLNNYFNKSSLIYSFFLRLLKNLKIRKKIDFIRPYEFYLNLKSTKREYDNHLRDWLIFN